MLYARLSRTWPLLSSLLVRICLHLQSIGWDCRYCVHGFPSVYCTDIYCNEVWALAVLAPRPYCQTLVDVKAYFGGFISWIHQLKVCRLVLIFSVCVVAVFVASRFLYCYDVVF